ncbi:glycosyl hydrolase [Kordiimonas sediminis]|uniref:beta-N-acetylhexosaminidase n=1 Tax=Kordiimonas sediminis TaxID=1735581 RepID=A0A919AVP9_9PROT|nr:beta-N-acetylhexosaminidase [Kordiimonas sediminis]GHF25978.1 glycosyl hydrolase [Kordiimonas sediminis]
MIPVIFGCEGPQLTDNEKSFFREVDPIGFILFARNVVDKEQLYALTSEMRAVTGRDALPILIDQEGGRVQRMKAPHWRNYPPASVFGDLACSDEPSLAASALRLHCRLIADDLRRSGITVNCLPVLDVPQEGSSNVIGDRAFSDDPELVGMLGRIACDGLREGGVLPVLKHIPGHGRALVDSHLELPTVESDLAELSSHDFRPFEMLSDMPLAMTAHVRYTQLDDKAPCTLSRIVISRIIRMKMGFRGILLSDDLSMQALSGSLKERATGALSAGCDIALHCNGNMEEMQDIASAVPFAATSLEKQLAGLIYELHRLEPADRQEMEQRYNQMMQDAGILQTST